MSRNRLITLNLLSFAHGYTKLFAEWGKGEEGLEVLKRYLGEYDEKPSHLGFIQKDIVHLLEAIENPDWRDVPYISLSLTVSNCRISI